MYLPRKYKILLLLLVWRLSSVFLVQTTHVPDKYWQSLEVAHHLAFGYGYLTWEWTANIRNYIYPFLISIIYRILALISLDYVTVLTTVPRIFQALITAYGEFKFYQWTKNKWTLYSLCINWYWYILICEPNFHNSTNYVDEADAFLADPMQWLSHNYNENDAATIPTHVITFDNVSPKIVQFLEHYQLISEIFYTHFPQSNYGRCRPGVLKRSPFHDGRIMVFGLEDPTLAPEGLQGIP
ncbi:PREDICTED: GPI mannosyltransferase 3-like [Dufourea novaeangliae]|uniref:GPI mannosyltransferase 3-like n=1 Tax=Dufourea novaeangliae TaxID=178035 RepID=UPI0007675E10|nr:PREDICTED: GPI mannosyltransferase 3-like [Dufourea novaeangliae]